MVFRSAENDGATMWLMGVSRRLTGWENGLMVGGYLFDNVKPEMVSYKERIFGAVLVVVRVDSMQKANGAY